MTENENKFKENFNKLEIHLKNKYFEGKYKNFVEMIKILSDENPIVNEYYKDLYALAKLRNAIFHGDSSSYYAIPTKATINKLITIREKLENPQTIDIAIIQPIFALDIDTFSDVIEKMIEKDFSQLPVQENNVFIGMITLEKISKFLWSNKQDLSNWRNRSINEQMFKSIFDNNYKIMNSKCSVIEIINEFDKNERSDKPIVAIFISDFNNPNIITGIITPHDINRLYKEIKV